MMLHKLKEALAELMEIENQIRSVIQKIEDSGAVGETFRFGVGVSEAGAFQVRDRIDLIVSILQNAGSPLHIGVISQRLGIVESRAIKRTEIEPGMNRHVANVKRPRIAKFGPSVFGLPEWRSGTVNKESPDSRRRETEQN